MFSFLPEQTFFIFCPAIKLANLLQSLAFFGQTATQCIQEMHLSLSVSFGLFKGIAPAGHSFVHRPQELPSCRLLLHCGTYLLRPKEYRPFRNNICYFLCATGWAKEYVIKFHALLLLIPIYQIKQT